MFGVEPSALKDQLISALFAPPESDYLIRQFTLLVDSGRAVRFEMPFGFRNQQVAPLCEVKATRVNTNCVLVEYIHDTIVTRDQQQIELLDRIIQLAPSALVLHRTLFDESGEITDFQIVKANKLALQWLNVDEDKAQKNPLSALVPDFRLSYIFQQYVHVAKTGESTWFERKLGTNWFKFSVAQFDDSIIVTVNKVTERKQAELALKQQTEAMTGILDAIPAGIFVSEAIRDAEGTIVDFKILEANATALRTNQRKRSDVISQLASVVFAGDRYNGLFDLYTTTIKTQQIQRFEHKVHQGWLDVQLAYIGSDRVLASYNDVTPLKMAEAERREQAETFTGVLRTMSIGLNVMEIIRDEAGHMADLRYQYISDQILLDTGLSREQIIGNRMLTLFPSVKMSRFWTAYEDLLATGEPQEFETSYEYDGYNNHLLCQTVLLDENRLISSYQIINELKEIQLAFQQQSELLRSVVDNVQVGIGLMSAVRDESGCIVDFEWIMTNRGNALITQLPEQVMLGAKMSQLMPGTVESGFLDTCVNVVVSGKPFQDEIRYTHDNRNGWYDIRIVKQGDGVLFSSSDVTIRKQAELDQERHNQILQRANRDLQLSNENLQQFAYVASHDLQEPLRKIQAFGDLLKDRFGPTLGPDGTDMLSRMQLAAKRMSLLIRDLLAYSRVSNQPDSHLPVSLSAIMNEVIDALYIAIQESGAQVTVTDLPELMGNPLQLNQLFQNLLGNAIKFRRPNAVPIVQVSCQTLSASQVPMDVAPRLDTSGNYAEITVSDNGIGFDAQYADRIFQVFQRLHGRNNYTGSGIGLSICRRVAENHGGTIIANSVPGQGATFRIYLRV